MPNLPMVDPRTLPRLHSWYSAKEPNGFGGAWPADAAAMAQWNDLSGNNRNLLQGTGGNQPTFRRGVLGTGTLPVVRYTDATDTMGFTSGAVNVRPITLIALFKNSQADDAALKKIAVFNAGRIGLGLDWTTANAFVAIDDNVAGATSGVVGDTTLWHVAAFVARGAGARSLLSVDGINTFPAGAAGTNTNSNVDVPVAGFLGDVAEVMTFLDEFPLAVIARLQTSMLANWGLTLVPLGR